MKIKAIVFEESGGIRLSEVALSPCGRLTWLLRGDYLHQVEEH